MSVIDMVGPTPAFVVTVPQNGRDSFQQAVHLTGPQVAPGDTWIESSKIQSFAFGDVADTTQDALIKQCF